MKKLRNLIAEYPKAAIIIPIVISLLMGIGITKLKIKDDIVEMLPKKMASRVALKELEKNFGAADFISITIGQKGRSIFNTSSLEKITRITDALEKVPFIESVKSLSNASSIKSTEEGIVLSPIMETVPSTAESLEQLQKRVFDEKETVGMFVSEDSQYGAIYVVLMTKHVDSPVIYKIIRKIIDKEKGPEEIHISGVPVIAGIVGESIRHDLITHIPLVLLVLTLILYIGLRNKRGVFLTMLVVVLSLLPPLGLMGFLGIPFMVISSTMPVIILALSSAYGIYVIMEYYRELAQLKDKTKAALKTINELFIPVTGAAFTAIVGFLAMVTSPLPVLFQYGIFVSIGTMWGWFLSFTMLPGLLIVLPTPKNIKSNPEGHRGVFHKLSKFFIYLTTRHKYAVIVSSAVITIFFASQIPKLRIEGSIDRFFQKNSEIRVANQISNDHFGGSSNLSVLIRGDLKDPVVLEDIMKLQNFLEKLEGIGSTSSIANVVCAINRAINNNDKAYYKIPSTRAAISQAILLYSMSADPKDFRVLVNSDFNVAHMNIKIKSMYSKNVRGITDKIKEYFPKHFPSNVTYNITGSSIFANELSEMTATSSNHSIIVALVAVFLIALFMYRSLVFSLLSIIPLSVTMIIVYGFMGFAHIDFSVEVSIICSIVIGVGIDYALRYLSRYSVVVVGNKTSEEIAHATIDSVGPPILSVATSISFAFLVLIFSILVPLKSLGVLTATSMLLASISTLTLLASIVEIVKPKVKCAPFIFNKETESK